VTLGADDVLYFCDTAGTGFVGLDASLAVTVQIPLASVRCSGGQVVLNQGGVLFFSCTDTSHRAGICAVQTASPGPAPVSWPRQYGHDGRSTFWLAP